MVIGGGGGAGTRHPPTKPNKKEAIIGFQELHTCFNKHMALVSDVMTGDGNGIIDVHAKHHYWMHLTARTFILGAVLRY